VKSRAWRTDVKPTETDVKLREVDVGPTWCVGLRWEMYMVGARGRGAELVLRRRVARVGLWRGGRAEKR
jgi:hypothetical protein